MNIIVTQVPGDFLNDRYVVGAGSRWPFSQEKNKSCEFQPYPFRMGYTSALLKRDVKDAKIKAIDPMPGEMSDEEFFNTVRSFSPDLIFIEVPTILWDEKLPLIKKIKDATKTKIAITGHHVTVFAKEVLEENDWIDFCLIGEYIEVAKELAKTMLDGRRTDQILGLGGRKESGDIFINDRRPLLNFKDLPWPDRDDLPAARYHDFTVFSPNVQMLASFGCPIRCSFCMFVHVMYDSPVYRKRDPKDVVDEMEYVKNEYGAKQVYFDDESFTVSKRYVLAICEEINKRDLRLPFTIMGDTMMIDEEVIKALSNVGCIGMKFGVESSDPQILKNINKPIDFQKTEQVVEWCRKHNIISHATFTFGLAGETRETMEKTLEYATNLKSDNAQFSMVVPYPGTPFYNNLKEDGYIIAEKWSDFDGSRKCVISYPSLSSTEIEDFTVHALHVYSKVAAKRKLRLAVRNPVWAFSKFNEFGVKKSFKIVKESLI